MSWTNWKWGSGGIWGTAQSQAAGTAAQHQQHIQGHAQIQQQLQPNYQGYPQGTSASLLAAQQYQNQLAAQQHQLQQYQYQVINSTLPVWSFNFNSGTGIYNTNNKWSCAIEGQTEKELYDEGFSVKFEEVLDEQ